MQFESDVLNDLWLPNVTTVENTWLSGSDKLDATDIYSAKELRTRPMSWVRGSAELVARCWMVRYGTLVALLVPKCPQNVWHLLFVDAGSKNPDMDIGVGRRCSRHLQCL